ncbi:MAG: hypothetical protein LBV04_08005 [Deferribacteraceae bacterium]|jgi:hypothetical protein|nr:hypothetical protein [Deferribacteraceae bacterium]
MKASDTLLKRAECYANGDFAAIHELYSVNSEFHQFFPDADSYATHAKEHRKRLLSQGITVLEEKSRGSVAQVQSLESFVEDGKAIQYNTKSTLRLEDGQWRIVSEAREAV